MDINWGIINPPYTPQKDLLVHPQKPTFFLHTSNFLANFAQTAV